MSSNFLFRSLRSSDITTIRSLLAKVFTENEPLTAHVKLSTASFLSILDLLLPILDHQTSIVAQHTATNSDTSSTDIAACLITTPFDAPMEETRLNESTLPILELISNLESTFKRDILAPKSVPESRVLHLAMGATREGYQGQGLLRGLMNEWLVKASDGRWDMAVAECTNPISRHLLRNKLGWKEGKVISYNAFEFNGSRPFHDLDGEATLVYKELSRST